MCGILGIFSSRMMSTQFLVQKLAGLEYRGYDSVGISYFLENSKIQCYKTVGDTSTLNYPKEFFNIGIGHTRWATHGVPSLKNCHPHLSNDGCIAIAHNGIIDNFQHLKSRLDYTFTSDTDSEIIAHLTHNYLKYHSVDGLPEFLIRELVGSYAIVIVIGNTLIGICNKSPLLLATDGTTYYLTSDVSILESGIKFKAFQDGDFIIINETIDIDTSLWKTLSVESTKKSVNHTWEEIHEQEHYITPDVSKAVEIIQQSKKIIFLGCGTSRHACLMGQKYLKRGRVEYPSEYVYDDEDLIICISQSGETIDLISAISKLNETDSFSDRISLRANIISIVNRENSSLERLSTLTINMNCGPEFGVASTKAFTSAVMIFYKMSCILNDKVELVLELSDIFKMNEQILKVSKIIKNYKNLFYLGSGLDFPIAEEGALKFKEVTYSHAEGYLTSEMKHGPIALLDNQFCTVILSSHNQRLTSNTIQELKTRNSRVINVSTEFNELADDNLIFKSCSPELDPLIINVILQLLAYHTAIQLGRNVDKPRNLAKSVTV